MKISNLTFLRQKFMMANLQEASEYKQMFKIVLTVVLTVVVSFALSFTFFSCRTFPVQEGVSRSIAGYGTKSPEQLASFFMAKRADADRNMVLRLASYYVAEAEAEGINSDVAFIQMCLETGFLRFGNLVTPDMHNYCGLGSIDAAHPGERFATEQLGVRAHIQHLHAYGTRSEVKLNNTLIDKRYKYVNPRGKAPDVFGLAGTWAADKQYGAKLDSLLSQLESF